MHIQNQTINIHIHPITPINMSAPATTATLADLPSFGAALLHAFMSSQDDEDEDAAMAAADQADTPGTIPADRPAIGQYWPGQGGIYAGDFLGVDGFIYGLIVADCGTFQDIGKAPWGRNSSLTLSDWDGLRNTSALIAGNHPAAKLAAEYTHDECTDFYLPARRELLLAAANLHDRFGKESWYWTSTPYAGCDSTAWVVDFENGDTSDFSRSYEFRVRPFRRFIY